MAPVLRETAKRGLIYVDDGSSPRSLAGQIAGANKLPFVKAEVVIDAVADAGRDRQARWRGSRRWRASAAPRSASARALPVTIDRVTRWEQGRREPRHRAGADQHGRAQAEAESRRGTAMRWIRYRRRPR